MSRIATPSVQSATGATAEVYAQIRKAAGSVPNTFAAIGAHGPAALKAVLQAEAVLSSGGLTRQDQETIKLLVSEVTGCDYCVAAHSMLGKMAGLKPEALKQIRELQRMLGKKTMENEILREAVEYGRAKKWIARSPSLPGDDQ